MTTARCVRLVRRGIQGLSFVEICDSLGFDPAYIRRGLRMTGLQLGGRTGRGVARRIAGSRTRVRGPRIRRVA
jgi:hypothetical protein